MKLKTNPRPEIELITELKLKSTLQILNQVCQMGFSRKLYCGPINLY
jgi:hypothetical protein